MDHDPTVAGQYGRLLEKLIRKHPSVPTRDVEKALHDAIRLSKPRTGPNSFVLLVAAMLLEDHPRVILRNRRAVFPFAFWFGLLVAAYLAAAWWYSTSA
jgi:hypothetical protein